MKNTRKKLMIEDLPKEWVNNARKAIEEIPQVAALKARYRNLLLSCRMVEAITAKKELDMIVNNEIQSFLDKYEGEAEEMSSLLGEMSNEDREEINTLTNSVIMLSDMIETFVMDFDQILHKYHPDFNMEMFDKMIALGKEAKAQVKFMSDKTSMCYQECFADEMDKTTELIRNKARSLARKINKKGKEKAA